MPQGRARHVSSRPLHCAALAFAALVQPVSAQSIFASGFELARPALAGGSNFHWYALGPDCEREPFGVIPNYHEFGVRDLVREQLALMRAEGQERLSIGIFFLTPTMPTADGRVTGTLLDSTGGVLQPQYLQNIEDLLADIRTAGFKNFLFRYFPQGDNDAKEWDQVDQARLEDNWGLIQSIEPLLLASGMGHGTDLLVEGMPRARFIDIAGNVTIFPNEPNKDGWSKYAREVWKRYATEFGVEHTVGFSFVSDIDDDRIDARVEHKDYVYTIDGQLTLPIALALDIYGTPERDERWIYERYRKHLVDEGMGDLPWVIAESLYDDAVAARGLAEAMTATGHSILYLTQWPLQRDATCNQGATVAPPVDYANWRRFGF